MTGARHMRGGRGFLRKDAAVCDFVTEIGMKMGYNIITRKEKPIGCRRNGKLQLSVKKTQKQQICKQKETNMSVLSLNKANFDVARNSDKPVLIDFYADWCGPCRMVSPIIDEIAEEYDEYLVCKVNVDKESELAAEFGVLSIPTLVVLRGGEVAKRVSGARPKAQILTLLEG